MKKVICIFDFGKDIFVCNFPHPAIGEHCSPSEIRTMKDRDFYILPKYSHPYESCVLGFAIEAFISAEPLKNEETETVEKEQEVLA